MIRFQVSTRHSGKLRRIQVVVHESKEQMYKAADRYNATIGHKDEKHDYEALTHMYQRYLLNEDGSDGDLQPDIAVLRFYKDQVGTEVTVHEVTHAAIHIVSLDKKKGFKFDGSDEYIPWIVGDLSRKVVTKFYDKGIYDGTAWESVEDGEKQKK